MDHDLKGAPPGRRDEAKRRRRANLASGQRPCIANALSYILDAKRELSRISTNNTYSLAFDVIRNAELVLKGHLYDIDVEMRIGKQEEK